MPVEGKVGMIVVVTIDDGIKVGAIVGLGEEETAAVGERDGFPVRISDNRVEGVSDGITVPWKVSNSVGATVGTKLGTPSAVGRSEGGVTIGTSEGTLLDKELDRALGMTDGLRVGFSDGGTVVGISDGFAVEVSVGLPVNGK
jgi:hypothetical protein